MIEKHIDTTKVDEKGLKNLQKIQENKKGTWGRNKEHSAYY